MTTQDTAATAALNLYQDEQRVYLKMLADPERSNDLCIEQGLLTARRYNEFLDIFIGGRSKPTDGDREDEDKFGEVIRSAHAKLYGVIAVGTFQHQVQDDPIQHDVTCTLIHDAFDVLSAAMNRVNAI